MLKRLFRMGRDPARSHHQLPQGQRIYAIADIHGRLDLLDRLLLKIENDESGRESADTQLIFLGDLVDRGPDSRGVIERLMGLRQSAREVVFIKGNHEEILIKAYRGDRRAAGLLNQVGGRETLLSYGVAEEEYENCDLAGLTALATQYIPVEHIEFLEDFSDSHISGDYLFVHAGIRPGVIIEEQKASDLRWVRREFLDYRHSHGKMVVHGHNITDGVDERPNRIGLDTGAFETGTLTAIGIEQGERWYLST